MIVVQLMTGDKEISRRKVTAESDWETVFQNLPRYDSQGEVIDYQVKEIEVNGYAAKIRGSAQKGFTIQNTYVGMKEPPSQAPAPDRPSTTERLPDVGDRLTLVAIALGLVCLRIAYLLYKETRSKKD